MSQLNALNSSTYAAAWDTSPELQLQRLVKCCRRWESRFFEPGIAIFERIANLIPQVAAEQVAALAVEAREVLQIRRGSLFIVREMARHKTHRHLVADTLVQVIQRADDMCEFVAIYWMDGRVPLSAQAKKGLAAAFPKFDEHELARCGRSGPVKLRDVLFLCHAKPRNAAQASVWKKLIWGRLTKPTATTA